MKQRKLHKINRVWSWKDLPEVMRNRIIQSGETIIRPRPSPRQNIIHNDCKPIPPLPNQITRQAIPTNLRLIRREIQSGSEEDGQGWSGIGASVEDGGSLKNGVESPTTYSI